MTVGLADITHIARQNATRDIFNLGPGLTRARIYSTLRPANRSIAPGAAPLVEFAFIKPAASVNSEGLLVLAPGTTSLVAVTGVPSWCRFVNGNGDAVLDCDAGPVDSAAEVWVSTSGSTGITIFEGGEVSVSVANFG